MSNTIISVENLAKRYFIGHQRSKDDGLRHRMEDAFRSPWRWVRELMISARKLPPANLQSPRSELSTPTSYLRSSTKEEFWALKDVSFEVNPGEVVGIIGRNGAGKSTLLKVLSRITEPTQGRIRLRGRVASILEVGTGFHPDLTGRENIFLNGAILGMTKAEIKRKFDEIVAFSEIEKFLDTPVKRYSSGMYVRLAFAVAAHLEPEILIIDEVLAVGDAAFQKKCLGKMREASSQEGRTVLFVSHNMNTVTRLCSTAIWLDLGAVKATGPAASICSACLSLGEVDANVRKWRDLSVSPGNEWVRLEETAASSEELKGKGFDITRPVNISLVYRVLKEGKVLIPNLHLYNEEGTVVFVSHDWHSGWRCKPKPVGRFRTTFMIPGNFLSEGRYTVRAAISTYRPFEVHVDASDAVAFTVVDSEAPETARGDYAGYLPGIVRPIIPSTTESLP